MSLDTERLRTVTAMFNDTGAEARHVANAIDKYFGATVDDRVVKGKEPFTKRWVHTQGGFSAPWQSGSFSPAKGGSSAPWQGGSFSPTKGGSSAPWQSGSFSPAKGGSFASPRGGSGPWQGNPQPDGDPGPWQGNPQPGGDPGPWQAGFQPGDGDMYPYRKSPGASFGDELSPSGEFRGPAVAEARGPPRRSEEESTSSDTIFDGFCGSIVRRSALSAGSAPSCRTRAPQNVPLSGTVMAQYQSGDYDRFANESLAPAGYPDEKKYGGCGCSSDDHLSRMRPASGFSPSGATAALSLYRMGGCGAR
jgi:hypothetical protein